ncbi:MAG: HhH-GPD family protein [Vulcanimicrobiaceae bacterium]
MTRLQRRLLAWYARAGRARLPWRTTRDPYHTLVSECMLQQTQVDRVVPAFTAFVAQFPTLASLAAASTADVLRMWKGLGYNSRAIRLQAAARAVVDEHGGQVPQSTDALRSLPGIGPYTAAAIRAFAFDLDDAPVDTNVRRIVHRLFYGAEYPPGASPKALATRAKEIVPAGMAHDWNSAMMDLGATLCSSRAPKCGECPVVDVCVAGPIDAGLLEKKRREHAKPLPSRTVRFAHTARYARGRIVDRLRELAPGERISLLDLHRDMHPLVPDRSADDITALVCALDRDGLLSVDESGVSLRESFAR